MAENNLHLYDHETSDSPDTPDTVSPKPPAQTPTKTRLWWFEWGSHSNHTLSIVEDQIAIKAAELDKKS